MGIGKQLLTWFASGLFIACGSKFAEYLATRVSQSRQRRNSTEMAGHDSMALCPQCGRNLRRFAKTLYCGQCGHREG